MTTKKTAVGLFSVKVKENGGDEVSIPTTDIVLLVKERELIVGGNNPDFFPANWGAQIEINQEIKPGSYKISDDLRTFAFYNSKENPGSSWMAKDGEIILDAVDLDKKYVKGSFNFTAVSRHTPPQSAEVRGDFSLTE
ncbi:hypothetical protein [Pseudomonas sp. LB1P83]